MESSIYQKKLYVKVCFKIISIQNCFFLQRANEHARAELKCLATRESLEMCEGQFRWKEICIHAIDMEEPIFAGLIETIDIEYVGDYASLSIRAVSGTILLDQAEQYRSYSKKQGYRQLMDFVLRGKGKAIYTSDNVDLKAPVMQYGETDWEFLKRAASSLGTCITPDINSLPEPRLYVGIRNGKVGRPFDTDNYKERWGREQRQVLRYEIDTYEDRKIGDRIILNGMELRICEKSGELVNGEFVFHYVVSNSSYFKRDICYNRKIQGMEVTGKVIDARGEWLKIYLEAEAYDENEVSFYYKWMPESGNLLYCMPENGSHVTLYFASDKEEDGFCINCVRKNSHEEREHWNNRERQFILPDGKTLFMNQNKLKLQGLDGLICFHDDVGIDINSGKGMTLCAVGSISMDTGTLLAAAPGEIDLIRKDILNPTMINMHDDIDLKGKIGRVDGVLHYDDKVITDKVFKGDKK